MRRISSQLLLIALTWLISASYLPAQDSSLSLLFIGDVMQHKDQILNAYDEKTGTYNYDTFRYIAPEITEADIAIANLEFTLGGPPYTGYPQFSAPDEIAVALKNAGIDILVTANNHSCDRREKGIVRTVEILDTLGIAHTGTYKDLDDKRQNFPLIIEKNGFRIALLNYTYGTNGIPVPENTIVDLIDEETILADLKLADSYLVDKTIVFFHWGNEYQRSPSKTQVNLARLSLDNGADIVIGSHPHVLQKMENTYNIDRNSDEVVIFSLGNFVSHQRSRYRDGGAMVCINLSKENSKIWVESVGYYLTWVHNPQLAKGEDFYVLPVSRFESDTVLLDERSREKMKNFAKDSRTLLRHQNANVFEYIYDLNKEVWKLN